MTPEQAEIIAHPWYVYLLVDSRNNKPFYVGITQNRKRRAKSHKSDIYSLTNQRIKEIHGANAKVIMRTVALFKTRAEAADLEAGLIVEAAASGKGYINQTLPQLLKAKKQCLWLLANPGVFETGSRIIPSRYL